MTYLKGIQYKSNEYARTQAELDADLADLTPVDALAKMADNSNIAIYLEDAEFIEMQDDRVADEEMVRKPRGLEQSEQFCDRLKELIEYLQYLRRDWERMNTFSSRLTRRAQVAEDFPK